MSCARRDHRGKEEGQRRGLDRVHACPQIFAALMQEDDLQKLVVLLLVTSIQFSEKGPNMQDTSLSFGNCTWDVINFIDDCLS